jgi:hypothetical protein
LPWFIRVVLLVVVPPVVLLVLVLVVCACTPRQNKAKQATKLLRTARILFLLTEFLRL